MIVKTQPQAVKERTGEKEAKERTGLATVPEVSRFLHVSRAKVYAMMSRAEIAYCKIGKSRRLRWEDVDRLVEAGMVQG